MVDRCEQLGSRLIELLGRLVVGVLGGLCLKGLHCDAGLEILLFLREGCEFLQGRADQALRVALGGLALGVGVALGE